VQRTATHLPFSLSGEATLAGILGMIVTHNHTDFDAFRGSPQLSQLHLTTSTTARRSLVVASDAPERSEYPSAMLGNVFVLHASTTVPSAGQNPLEIVPSASQKSWRERARAFTAVALCEVSSPPVPLAHLLHLQL